MENSGKTSLRLVILPKDISKDGRICTLAHPRTSNPSRYYFCPQKGIYEFVRIAAPRSAYQSWLLGPWKKSSISSSTVDGVNGPCALKSNQSDSPVTQQATQETKTLERSISDGFVAKTPELLVATPIDPLFIILPSFCTPSLSAKPSLRDKLFLSSEDLFEKLEANFKHLDLLLQSSLMQRIFQERMGVVCDTVEGGGEDMYRLNHTKLLRELLSKAEKMVTCGLPLSMEEKFVHKVLEEPIMDLNCHESPLPESQTSQDQSVASKTSSSIGLESQSIPTLLEPSVLETLPIKESSLGTNSHQNKDVLTLLRLRTALSYIMSKYLSPSLEAEMRLILASPEAPINFRPLDERLAQLHSLRAEAAASRSLANFSRKRSRNEDDEAAELRSERKKAKEEEEKRKKTGESRALRDLKKADTSGMKKMSDFFGKSVAVAPRKK